jgi:NAD(P)H-hydrate epimerase
VTALRVTTAAESAARDQAAIAAGVPSFDLMRNAGSASAALILREYSDRLAHGVALYAGSGNNGGDAYIVAAQLARAGVSVRMQITAPPRTAGALRAKAIADSYGVYGAPTGHERVVVDGLLGTGHRGALRDGIAAACARMAVARHAGATMVALDLPSGLDASTGEIADGSVAAHDTLCFGTIKRGVLLARAHAGRVVLLDIGLPHGDEGDDGDEGAHGDDHAWRLVSAGALARWVPPVAWDAHKGRRGRVIVVGGQEGMAGAVVLASRGALAAGAGVVHALVEAPSVAAVQALVPQAIAESWAERDTLRCVMRWP